jgi:hypothetical protein
MGRRCKQTRNITGLRNQPGNTSNQPLNTPNEPDNSAVQSIDTSNEWSDEDDDFDPYIKSIAYLDVDSDPKLDSDGDDEWKELEEEEFHKAWAVYHAMHAEDV